MAVFYIYQNWQSTFAPRKYLMTSVYALIIVLLAAVGLSPSPISQGLALWLYGIGAFAILVMLELIGYFYKKMEYDKRIILRKDYDDLTTHHHGSRQRARA